MNVICLFVSMLELHEDRARNLAYLHAILQLRYDWTLGNEGKELALHGVG